jgi:hypothetical protein
MAPAGDAAQKDQRSPLSMDERVTTKEIVQFGWSWGPVKSNPCGSSMQIALTQSKGRVRVRSFEPMMLYDLEAWDKTLRNCKTYSKYQTTSGY